MGILITPKSAVCGGKSCYAFPNGDSAYNHTCPGNSIIISTGTQGLRVEESSTESVTRYYATSDDCAEPTLEGEPIIDDRGCELTIGPCNDCLPETPGDDPGCDGFYQAETTECPCLEEYATHDFTIDPNSAQFSNALGWKLIGCPEDPSVARPARAYITGGAWYHACIGPNENLSFGGQLDSTFNLPFFPNGSAINGNAIRCSVVSERGVCSTLVLSAGVSTDLEDEMCNGENPTGKTCVEVYVHPNAGIFSPDEVERNMECYSQTADGSTVSRLRYENITKDAAVFDPRGVLFRSNRAFTIKINYATVICGDSDSDRCSGVGIKALRLDNNTRTCAIVSEDPVRTLQRI